MICTDQSIVTPWILAKLKIPFTSGFRSLGCMDNNGRLVGAAGYDLWTGTACEMHVAGSHAKWTTPKFMWAAFDYPFNMCGCDMVLVRTPYPNSAHLACRLGFKYDLILEGAHSEGPLHYLSMRRGECRWLKRGARYGREEAKDTQSA